MPAASSCTSCSRPFARITTSKSCGRRPPAARERAPPRRLILRIVALGHRMPAWVSAGYDDYAKRLPRELALTLTELKPEPRDRGRTVAQLLAAEAVRLAAACAGATVVALDERGSLWT